MTSTKTKNREDHITDLFKALPEVEGFEYTTEELFKFFDRAVRDKKITLRAFSKSKKNKDDDDAVEKQPTRLSGYNLFTKEFKHNQDIDVTPMVQWTEAWKIEKNIPGKKEEWDKKAEALNTANGIQKKSKPAESYKSLIKNYTKRERLYTDKYIELSQMNDPALKAKWESEMETLFPEGRPIEPIAPISRKKSTDLTETTEAADILSN